VVIVTNVIIPKREIRIQSPALLVDSEVQLWTAMVSCTWVDAVLAAMNTAHFQRCFLKAEWISYKRMSLIISGTTYKKLQKFTKSKVADFAKILEMRPISGQAFSSFIGLHAENVLQRNRNYLNFYWKNIKAVFYKFWGSRRAFWENMNIFKIIKCENSKRYNFQVVVKAKEPTQVNCKYICWFFEPCLAFAGLKVWYSWDNKNSSN
jgi:hypothetical protein